MGAVQLQGLACPKGWRGGPYLRAAAPLSALSLLLFFVASHSWSVQGEALFLRTAAGLAAVGLAWLAKAPRWLIYLGLSVLSVIATYDRVFTLANGPQDAASDRDECVESAARAFLAGRDAWSAGQADLSLTTGYSAVLLLAPFVAVFGRINEAACLFWLLMLTVWLLGDLRSRSGSYLVLSLAYLGGLLDIFHTQNWSLDELYFPFLLLTLAWVLATRQHLVATGMLVAICVLWRANYAFVSLGFLVWLLLRTPQAMGSSRTILRLCLGGCLGTFVVVAPFWALFGSAGLLRGPLAVAYDYAIGHPPRPDPLVALLASVGVSLAPTVSGLLRVGIGVVLALWLSMRIHTFSPYHPFWHICVSAWIAQAFVWHVSLFRDYQLMIVLPACLAITFGRRSPKPSPSTQAVPS